MKYVTENTFDKICFEVVRTHRELEDMDAVLLIQGQRIPVKVWAREISVAEDKPIRRLECTFQMQCVPKKYTTARKKKKR